MTDTFVCLQFAGSLASITACMLVNLAFMDMVTCAEYNSAIIMNFVVGISYQIGGYVHLSSL